MDEQAIEEITKRINPERGFQSEVNRVLRKNDSLKKSGSWNSATPAQKRALRDRITVDESKETSKFQRNDKTYIRVDENNFKRVTSEDDVLVTDDGRVFLRDSKGQAKEMVK